MRSQAHEESIAAQAARLRQALLERHGASFDGDLSTPSLVDSAIEEATRLARITAHWGITPALPVVGPFEVLVKRVTRLGLRWYINPIVEQQNAFNDAVVAALHELRAEQDHLRTSSRRAGSPAGRDQ